MTLVPPFCVRSLLRQKERRSSFFSVFGSMLGLAALIGLLSFVSSAQAQTSDKPNPKVQAYTIVATPDGSSLCHDATPQESERMAHAQESGENLRLINHLEYLENINGSQTINVDDPSLPGLKIFLLAEPRLDANPTAKAAFIKAAKNWEDIIKTPMTIYIKVDLGPDFFGDMSHPYSTNTIGSTSSALTSRNYMDVRAALINTASNANEIALYSLLPTVGGALPTDSGNIGSIFISYSIARAIGFLPANASATDFGSMPQIGFNSAFNFDYDQSDGISSSLVDFTAVATHEIGHALGFSSTAGDTSPPIYPAVLDLFRFRPGVTDFTSTPRIMTIGGGPQIFFAGSANIFSPPGTSEAGLSNGGPAASTANGGDGRQSSHWRDDTTALGGIHYGIMDPTIANGRREVILANDVTAFNYLGYNLENSVLPQGPANDLFASAQTITGCSGSVTGTNIGSSKEVGEPSHAPNGNAGGASVWYQWTAPSTGSVTITTANSSFDTVLAVYTGTSIGALPSTVVAKNDDVSSSTRTSSVTFNATAGVIYRIVVDGYDNGGGSETGSITLNWAEQNCGVTSQPTLQLNQSSYSIAEGTGSLDLLVNRSGNSSLPVAVNYTTTDAAAFLQNCNVTNGIGTSRCDYVGVLGTLHFAAGETSKTISIPIVDDTYLEGAESFFVSLSNPSGGAVLGTNQRSPITITDNGNDSAGQSNPIDNQSFFVRQHYIDFLSREPDPLSAGWITILNQCGAGDQSCRLTVSQGIYGSPEFRDRGYFIYKFYSVSLGRKPSYDEFNVDRARVSGFQTDAELEQSKVDFIADFMSRAEFTNIYNGLSNNAYVQQLFTTAGVTQITVAGLGVQIVSTEQQLLAGGRTRAQVLRDVAESPEVSSRFQTESTVVMHYFGYLRRDPDASYQNWITILTTTGDSRNVTSGFIGSAEYRARFGQ